MTRRLFLMIQCCVLSCGWAQDIELGLPTGHTSSITDIDLSPDNTFLITSSEDFTTKFWDLKSGRVLATLNRHQAGVKESEIHTSGRYLLTHSYDSSSILWDASTFSEVYTFKTGQTFTAGATFHPKKEQLAYLGRNNTIVLWNITTKRDSERLVGHEAEITSFTYSADGKLLVSGDKSGKVCLFNTENGKKVTSFQAHKSKINDVQFSPNDSCIITSSFDKRCKIWHVETGKMKLKLKKFKNEVYGMDIHPSGTWGIVKTNDDRDQVWNLETGKKIKSFEGQSVFKGSSMFSPSGKYLFLSGNFDHPPAVYETETLKKICDIPFNGEMVLTACFNEDETKVILGLHSVNKAIVFNVLNGEKVTAFDSDVSAIMSARFGQQDRIFISTKSGSVIRCNITKGSVDGFLKAHQESAFDVRPGWKENIIVTSSEDNTSKIYNLKIDSLLMKIPIYGTWENQTRLSADKKYILSATLDHKIECRNANDFKLVYQLPKKNFTSFEVCPSKDLMVLYSPYQEVELVRISDGKTSQTIPNHGYTVNQAAINKNAKYVAVLYAKTWQESLIKIWDVQKKKYIDSLPFEERLNWIMFDPTGSYLVYPNALQTDIELYDLEKKKVVQQLKDHEFGALGATFSTQKNTVLTVGGDQSVRIYDLKNARLIQQDHRHKNNLSFVDSDSSGRIFATASWDGSFILWDAATGTFLQQWYFFKDDPKNMLIINNEGYYKAGKNATQGVYFVVDKRLYPMEQFDLRFNRPDKVLASTPMADSSLIAAYHSAYKKRLKKMGFTEDMLQDDFHLPEIDIENFEQMPTIIDEDSIDLNLNMEDSKYKLDRINVWVNDVAIYGTDGISLRDQDAQKLDKMINVELAKGQNKVQVSVLNKAGAESYKETFEVKCTIGKKEPDLYLITIGESEFKQSDYNLTYAAKDAKDIASLFPKSKVYDEVFTKTLTNDQVTRENIVGLKSFLEKADINDHVMVFLAGHGVLSSDLDYYLATYDMDFTSPEEKGLMYEDLEGLLDGIKPLKKTLILDACHSGEIDKESVVLADNTDLEQGDVQFRAVGNNVESKLGAQNTFELTKSLFTDLRKGTGATVISSAGGMEFAMEGDDWNNGLFTFALIDGIQSGEADLNNDNQIWLSELKEYVGNKVTELSNGKQQPTSRIENKSVDFRVW